MPFVFVVIGILFLVVAVRGTQTQMFALLKSEFVGTNSFVPWAAAILILGAIGYAKPIKPIADAMIGLIILVMLLANKGGFFSQLNAGINNPVAPTVAASPTLFPAATPAQIAGANQAAAGTLLNPGTTPSTLAPGFIPPM